MDFKFIMDMRMLGKRPQNSKHVMR